MRIMPVRRQALAKAALCWLLGCAPAWANDSTAVIGLGGLTLTHSAEIRLDQQELFISRERVRVNYVFTNTTVADIETLVAFPLPDFTHETDQRVPDYVGALNFRTLVEGQPVRLELVQQARRGGQDISARLRALGLPFAAVHPAFSRAVNALPAATRSGLIREGLIEESGSDGRQRLWDAKWSVSTSVTRQQLFPAGRSIRVEHSYVPFAGGSVGGNLGAAQRRTPSFRTQQARYCMDDRFLAALDRRTVATSYGANYNEVWLQYMLTPGANWAGPIRDFRLVVDKGNPASLVSFCATGVRRLDERRFEVRYSDFRPDRELDILIVDFRRD